MNTIDKTQLSSKELMIFNQEVENWKKNSVVAYLIWWFFGFMGGHRYYFGKTQSAVAMTLIFWLGVWVFGLGAAITLIWAIIDVFSIGSWLREDTQKVEEQVFNELQLGKLQSNQATNVTPAPAQNPTPAPVQNRVSQPAPKMENRQTSASFTTSNSVSTSTSLSTSQSGTAVSETASESTATQTQRQFCNQCGAKLVEGATFCTNCGAKVDAR